MQGYNGTVMCYGQTGAGKTFTMTGSSTEFKYRGIVPRAVAQIYREVGARFDQAVTIRVSFVEIYNEMVRNTPILTRFRCSTFFRQCPRTSRALPLCRSRRTQGAV